MDVFSEIAASGRGARARSGRRRFARRPSASACPCSRRSRRRAFALGLETVYEAYLVHYGRPRLFAPGEESERVLLGDYLYAHGLVRISEAGGVDAVATMAELISRCAALRAAGEPGDGEAWLDAARALGGDRRRRSPRPRPRRPRD